MFVVVFEFEPYEKFKDEYFDLTEQLRHDLEKIDGFISVERFASVTNPGKFVSLSVWRDEKAIRCWRTREKHRRAQMMGRTRIFSEYRIRVCKIARDYGLHDRIQVPQDSLEAEQA